MLGKRAPLHKVAACRCCRKPANPSIEARDEFYVIQSLRYKGAMSIRVLFLLSSVFCLALWSLMPVAAATQSAWVDKEPVRVRLAAAEHKGQAYIMVQLRLQPGWHTYWRYPGASGIAPAFDFKTNRNARLGKAQFPAPYFFDDEVGGFFGYDRQVDVAIPVTFKRRDVLTEIELNAFIGVCREICVPMSLKSKLTVMPAALATSPHGAALADMLDARPVPPSPDMAVARISFDGVSLQVVITGRQLQTPVIMLIPGPHDVIGPSRVLGAHPEAYLFEIPAWSKLDHPLIGRMLTLVVRDGVRAIEQNIVVEDHRLLPIN